MAKHDDSFDRHEERPGLRTFVVQDTITKKLYVIRTECYNRLYGHNRVKYQLAEKLNVSETRLDVLWGTMLESDDVLEISSETWKTGQVVWHCNRLDSKSDK